MVFLALVAYRSGENARTFWSTACAFGPPCRVEIDDRGRGGHYLWWLLFVSVHEARAGRGNPVMLQALLEAADREVRAGRADRRLTAIVEEARRPTDPAAGDAATTPEPPAGDRTRPPGSSRPPG